MKSPKTTFVIFILLIISLLNAPLVLMNAQDRDNCQDFRVYGDENHQNYIQFKDGSNTRIIYFDKVTMHKTGDAGYLVSFPVFGIAPVAPENEPMDPDKLLPLVSAKDFDFMMSQVNLHVRPASDDPYFFNRSSISTIDCLIDQNRFNPSIEALMDPLKSDMDHRLIHDNDKVVLKFSSVSKEDNAFSMKMHVEAESIPVKELEDNFRAENAGDTLKARIYLYQKAGFLSYQTRFGLVKTVQLPNNGSKLSGYIEKDFAKVYEFETLTADQVSFRIHNVKRTPGNKYKKAIMDPLASAGTTLDELTLDSETFEGVVVSAELVNIAGDPVLIDHSKLPEMERYYASPIRLELQNREVGLSDLPEDQAFPLSIDLRPFRYSLVSPNMRSIEVTVNETPEQFFIDVKRGDMKNFASEIQFQRFLDDAGEYADPVMDFIIYISDNFNEAKEKDQSWWEDQLKSMGVEPTDTDNPMDHLKALEDKYKLSNSNVRSITEKRYNEKYSELSGAYTSIIRMKSYRFDTARYADQAMQLASGLGIHGLQREDWLSMLFSLEDSLRVKYPENVLIWALNKAGEKNESVTRFTFATTKEGKISNAEFLSPSGYDGLKISYFHEEDSVRLGISHPRQEYEQRTFPVDRGIADIHYLFALLPWYDYTGDRDTDYFLMGTKGTTYGRGFYITPVFYRMNFRLQGEETIGYVNREIDTYKLQLTFNIVPERPAILFSELSGMAGQQPVTEVWVSQEKPHLPVKMKVGNEVYWMGPRSQDPGQAGAWYEWIMEKFSLSDLSR